MIYIFSTFILTLIMQLLEDSLAFNKIINYMAHLYILSILLEEVIILEFERKSLFFKYVKLFYSYISRFFKNSKISSNFQESSI